MVKSEAGGGSSGSGGDSGPDDRDLGFVLQLDRFPFHEFPYSAPKKYGQCDIMRIAKQINKITRLADISKRYYWSPGFPKRNHSPNKTVASASRGYPTSSLGRGIAS
ncbi:hypothetical protein LXL04_023812 [Taraxacum kok-saghyz]